MSVRSDRFFQLLADHQDVLEFIQDEKGIEENRLREIIRDFQESTDDRSVEYLFQQLLDARIILPITEDHDNVFEVATPVREVLQYINQDYDILGIESIESYFQTLDRNREKLQSLLRSGDVSGVEIRLDKIDRALKRVHREVEQNRRAIENKVDEFNQAEDNNRSLKKQFQLIESLWEDYVQPLGRLVDPAEKPREKLSRVGEVLRKGQREFSHHDELERSFRFTFQRLQYFIDVFQQSFDAVRREIKPLRRQYRHSDKFLEGASHLLESIRMGEEPAVNPDEWLRFPYSQNEGLSDDDEIKKYFMKISRYEPVKSVELNPPTESGQTAYHSPFQIARSLEDRDNIGDVLECLLNRSEELSTEVILQAYGYCFRNWNSYYQDDEPEEYHHNGTRLRLYPIRVED